jgi:hypothetical protein
MYLPAKNSAIIVVKMISFDLLFNLSPPFLMIHFNYKKLSKSGYLLDSFLAGASQSKFPEGPLTSVILIVQQSHFVVNTFYDISLFVQVARGVYHAQQFPLDAALKFALHLGL